MENNKEKKVSFLPRLNMLVTSSFRSMTAWWCSSVLLSAVSKCLRLFHFLFIALMLIQRPRRQSVVAHKAFGMALKWMYRDGERDKKRGKKRKINTWRKNGTRSNTFFLSHLERTFSLRVSYFFLDSQLEEKVDQQVSTHWQMERGPGRKSGRNF